MITAGELVGGAVVEAQETKAIRAARFLLSDASSATAPLRCLAARALTKAGLEGVFPRESAFDPQLEKRKWRHRTRKYSTNCLAWVELSLRDVIDGKKCAAERSMLVALQLAPNNRHVLRSASRLFLHLGDPGRAYDIIANCDAIVDDPWLIAAELAIASLAKRRPRYYKQGCRMIAKSGLAPRQITELTSAIGTLELNAGYRKKARDYFRKSVIDPTGNALAQAEWVSPSLGFELVSPRCRTIGSEVDEANVFHLLNDEKFSTVPDACLSWSAAEPYRIHPYEIASSAAALIGDHDRTLDIAKNGLKIRPKSGMLLNNYAFSLAHVGQLKEAEQALNGVKSDDKSIWLVSEANRGLLAMRRRESESGLAHYKEAINGFRRLDMKASADIASVYLAREAAMAGIGNAEILVNEAREIIGRLKTTRHNHVMEQAEQALGETRTGASLNRAGFGGGHFV